MSTAYAERSSFERNICSLGVVGWQITHEQHHGLGLCVCGFMEGRIWPGDVSLGRSRIWERRVGARGLFLRGGGRGTFWCKKVIALMNVYKKNYVYRRLSVKTRIYCSLGEMLAVASLVVNGYRAGQ